MQADKKQLVSYEDISLVIVGFKPKSEYASIDELLEHSVDLTRIKFFVESEGYKVTDNQFIEIWEFLTSAFNLEAEDYIGNEHLKNISFMEEVGGSQKIIFTRPKYFEQKSFLLSLIDVCQNKLNKVKV